jgi:pimeloyl-ACP methyl ester carboxylesterase
MLKTLLYPYPVKKVTIGNNVQIAYMDEGSGPQTFVFIHGLANYAPVFKHQIAALSRNARCIALDLPGNGLSPYGDYPYGVFFYAECVKLFCDALKMDNITLVGHSMGGQIGIMLALRYSNFFNKLALIAPAGIEHFSTIDTMMMQNMLNLGDYLYSDEFHIQQAISESFYTQSSDKKTIISDLQELLKAGDVVQWRKMAKACINSMLNQQVSGFLSEISIPVTLIFGSKDAMIPNRLLHPGQSIASLVKHAEALIPDINSYIINDAGHFVHIEKADETNTLLLKH